MNRFLKYILFVSIIFGGLAITFIQAGGTVPNLINIEGGNIDVSDGNIRLNWVLPGCDPDLYFCEIEKAKICISQFPDEDYIVVAKANIGSYQWKTSQTYCVGPQCEDLNGSMTLVADNEVDFSEYPARNACKSYEEGARLATQGELSCIYNNQSDFGGNFDDKYLWAATETGEAKARSIPFSSGSMSNSWKDAYGYVRCVSGYSD